MFHQVVAGVSTTRLREPEDESRGEAGQGRLAVYESGAITRRLCWVEAIAVDTPAMYVQFPALARAAHAMRWPLLRN